LVKPQTWEFILAEHFERCQPSACAGIPFLHHTFCTSPHGMNYTSTETQLTIRLNWENWKLRTENLTTAFFLQQVVHFRRSITKISAISNHNSATTTQAIIGNIIILTQPQDFTAHIQKSLDNHAKNSVILPLLKSFKFYFACRRKWKCWINVWNCNSNFWAVSEKPAKS